jgi:hypothetical protein
MGKPVVYNATMVGREDLSPTLALFRVLPDEVPPPGRPWFEPGQYVSLGLNVDDPARPHATLRPYSIASAPEERRWLELYIRLASVPESPGAVHPPSSGRCRWGTASTPLPRSPGASPRRRPCGPEDRRVRVFAAAGTGIAPFVSAAKSAAARGRRRPAGPDGGAARGFARARAGLPEGHGGARSPGGSAISPRSAGLPTTPTGRATWDGWRRCSTASRSPRRKPSSTSAASPGRSRPPSSAWSAAVSSPRTDGSGACCRSPREPPRASSTSSTTPPPSSIPRTRSRLAALRAEVKSRVAPG